MKKLFLTAQATVLALSAWAYDYPYLTFQRADGTLQSVAVESLTITIADGQLVATNATGSKTFTLTELSKMYFSDSDVTAISQVASSTDSRVTVYTLQGTQKGEFDSLQAAQNCLDKGVYLVKSATETIKIAVK